MNEKELKQKIDEMVNYKIEEMKIDVMGKALEEHYKFFEKQNKNINKTNVTIWVASAFWMLLCLLNIIHFVMTNLK